MGFSRYHHDDWESTRLRGTILPCSTGHRWSQRQRLKPSLRWQLDTSLVKTWLKKAPVGQGMSRGHGSHVKWPNGNMMMNFGENVFFMFFPYYFQIHIHVVAILFWLGGGTLGFITPVLDRPKCPKDLVQRSCKLAKMFTRSQSR